MKKAHKQVSIFTTAGYPALNSLSDQFKLFEKYKIDFVEVGIPFSDPLADGPTIQRTSEIALKNGMNIDLLFSELASFTTAIPIVLMGYFNPILKYGMEDFLVQCSKHGVFGLIIPDLPMEIFELSYSKIFQEYNIAFCPLITPNTEKTRLELASKISKNGFVYLVSSNATTGSNVPFNFEGDRLMQLTEICTETPVFVGFGVKGKSDIEQIHHRFDGAIIGSAYLESLEKGKHEEFLKSITMTSYQQ
jgi:tryptophan synthase alpha chain